MCLIAIRNVAIQFFLANYTIRPAQLKMATHEVAIFIA